MLNLLMTGIFVKLRNGDIGMIFGDKILFMHDTIKKDKYVYYPDNTIKYIDNSSKINYSKYDIINLYNITEENCNYISNYDSKIRGNGVFILGIEYLIHLSLDTKLHTIANDKCCIWKEGN